MENLDFLRTATEDINSFKIFPTSGKSGIKRHGKLRTRVSDHHERKNVTFFDNCPITFPILKIKHNGNERSFHGRKIRKVETG